MDNIFEIAARNKYRFSTSKGPNSAMVEDLFDLPLLSERGPCLQAVASGLYRELQDNSEPDFVGAGTAANSVLQTKLEIVKRVIEIKKEEADKAKQLRDRREQRQRLLELRAKKLEEADSSKTVAELDAMLTELDKM